MSMSQTGPLVEGKSYPLQCDVLNVAPVGILSIHWHSGSKVFHTETFSESGTDPGNRSSSVRLLANREDNGNMIWCEAKLNFGPTGPDIIPTKSQPREVTVLCKFLSPSGRHCEVCFISLSQFECLCFLLFHLNAQILRPSPILNRRS